MLVPNHRLKPLLLRQLTKVFDLLKFDDDSIFGYLEVSIQLTDLLSNLLKLEFRLVRSAKLQTFMATAIYQI